MSGIDGALASSIKLCDIQILERNLNHWKGILSFIQAFIHSFFFMVQIIIS